MKNLLQAQQELEDYASEWNLRVQEWVGRI